MLPVSVEAVWCNRTLEFVRKMKRGAGDANVAGAAGSMRAIPLINPGSMRVIAANAPAGSMRMLTAAPPPAGSMRTLPSALPPAAAAAGGAGTGIVDASGVHVAVAGEAPAGAAKPTFARKVKLFHCSAHRVFTVKTSPFLGVS